MIKRVIHIIKQECKKRKFNKLHQTYIESRYADLEANYGVGVRIGKNSYVDKDCSIGDYSYVNKNSSLEKCRVEIGRAHV